MKLKKLRLENFKGFSDYELDLSGPDGQPRDVTVLVGENGCGKSTLLQAIALPLALATRRIRGPNEFEWPGFVLERLDWPSGRRTSMELQITFDDSEIGATREFADHLARLGFLGETYVPPGSSQQVTLRYERGVRCDTPSEFFQFHGRGYAAQLYSAHERPHEIFDRVGGVFWFDQERRATSLAREGGEEPTMASLREELIRWELFHQRARTGARPLDPGARDFYDELSTAYARLFPGRKFVGVQPQPAPLVPNAQQDFWFMLDDGRMYYELDEMSSGERAVFPILFDFVKWRINKSVILLDEVELHLHPPLQQFLIETLPKLGTDNQFIMTTHSQEVVNVLPDEVLHRVEGATVDGDARREAAVL